MTKPPVLVKQVTIPAPPPLPKKVSTDTQNTSSPPSSKQSGKSAEPMTLGQKIGGGIGSLITMMIIFYLYQWLWNNGLSWEDVTAKYLNNAPLLATPDYQNILANLQSHPGSELRFLEVKFSSRGGKYATGFTVKGSSLKIRRIERFVQMHPCPNGNKSIDIKVDKKQSASAAFWVIADAELIKDIDAKSITIEYEEGYSNLESYRNSK